MLIVEERLGYVVIGNVWLSVTVVECDGDACMVVGLCCVGVGVCCDNKGE